MTRTKQTNKKQLGAASRARSNASRTSGKNKNDSISFQNKPSGYLISPIKTAVFASWRLKEKGRGCVRARTGRAAFYFFPFFDSSMIEVNLTLVGFFFKTLFLSLSLLDGSRRRRIRHRVSRSFLSLSLSASLTSWAGSHPPRTGPTSPSPSARTATEASGTITLRRRPRRRHQPPAAPRSSRCRSRTAASPASRGSTPSAPPTATCST